MVTNLLGSISFIVLYSSLNLQTYPFSGSGMGLYVEVKHTDFIQMSLPLIGLLMPGFRMLTARSMGMASPWPKCERM